MLFRSSVVVANSTGSGTLTPASLSVAGFVANTTRAGYANAYLDLNAVRVGNTTVNTVITSTSIDTDGQLIVGGNSTFTGNTATVGQASFSNTVTVKGGTVLDGIVNNDIGATIGNVVIYTFPAATYKTGKFEVQIANGGNTQHQKSEMVLAHDDTTAYLTTYGTVAAPPAANGSNSPLGTFSANINSGSVEIVMNQLVANSGIKVSAHLTTG